MVWIFQTGQWYCFVDASKIIYTGVVLQIAWDVDTPTQLVFRIANASYDRDAGKVRITDTDVGFNGQYTDTLLDFKGVRIKSDNYC